MLFWCYNFRFFGSVGHGLRAGREREARVKPLPATGKKRKECAPKNKERADGMGRGKKKKKTKVALSRRTERGSGAWQSVGDGVLHYARVGRQEGRIDSRHASFAHEGSGDEKGRRRRRRTQEEEKRKKRKKRCVIVVVFCFGCFALLCFALLACFLFFFPFLDIFVCMCVCFFTAIFLSFLGVVFLFFLVWLVLCERRNCFCALEGRGKVCCFSLGNSTLFWGFRLSSFFFLVFFFCCCCCYCFWLRCFLCGSAFLSHDLWRKKEREYFGCMSITAFLKKVTSFGVSFFLFLAIWLLFSGLSFCFLS